MRWYGLSALVASLLATGIANAANEIHVWYAYPDPNGAVVDQTFRKVTITLPGVYKIDVTGTTGLGIIDKIWIDTEGDALDDDVVIYVVRSGATPHQPGALQVKSVNLTNVVSGKHGILEELRCTGNLGDLDIVTATDAGTIAVSSGSLLHPLVVTGDISGPLSFGGFLRADISAGSLSALTVSGIGTPPVGVFPTITIGRTYGAALTVNQTIANLTIE